MNDRKPLSKISNLITDRIVYKKDESLPYIGLEYIEQGSPFLIGKGESQDSTSTNTVFRTGDILFGKLRPNLRKSLRVDFDGYCSTDILVIRASPGYSAEFVARAFQQEIVFRRAEQTAIGTKMPRTSWHDLEQFVVFVPDDIDEQVLIAAILDTVDDAIRYTEQVIAKLKQVRVGLLHDLLTYGIDENGGLRDPVRHPEQFEDGLPIRWQSSAIEGVSNYVGSGITPRGGREVYVSSGILFIRSQNVQFDGIDLDDIAFIDLKTHERMKNSELQANDVLLNITGASIGRCYHMPEESLPANVNQHVCAIRLQHPTLHDAIYVSAVLGSYIGQSQITQQNAGGSREGLNYKQVRSLVLPWPQSRNERIEIALRIEVFDRNVLEERIFLSKLLLLKQGLMDDLLTGRVRVADFLSAEE